MKRNRIDPLIEIIPALNEDHSFLMEICLIEVIGRKDLSKGPLLNLTNGGEGMSGNIRSPETRAKIGRANIGKDRTHTEKSKLKISESCTGRKDTKDAKEKKKISNRRKTAKLKDNQVIEIFLSTKSSAELSTIYKVSKNQIYGIKRRIYWKFLTENLVNG